MGEGGEGAVGAQPCKYIYIYIYVYIHMYTCTIFLLDFLGLFDKLPHEAESVAVKRVKPLVFQEFVHACSS